MSRESVKLTSLSYIIFQGLPVLADLVISDKIHSIWLRDLFIVSLEIVKFFMVKSLYGQDLVGLSWDIEPNFDKQTIISYRSSPNLPNGTGSNIFWVGLFTSILIWIIIALSQLITLRIHSFLISLISLIIEFVNFIGFFEAHRQSRREMADRACGVLLENGIRFEMVEDEEIEDVNAD